jgi:hypothetical protein
MGGRAMKWEYRVIFLQGAKSQIELAQELEVELNRLGMDGWEAVGITAVGMGPAHVVVLKRKIN